MIQFVDNLFDLFCQEVDTQKLKSDVTEAEISNTITNMANLLEQS